MSPAQQEYKVFPKSYELDEELVGYGFRKTYYKNYFLTIKKILETEILCGICCCPKAFISAEYRKGKIIRRIALP